MRRLCPHCQKRFDDQVEQCPVHRVPLRADPFVGVVIDNWTLVDFIGQGAMGVVYAASPTAAVKILHARRAAMQPDLMRRFEIEAAAARRVESPHIARVHASGTTEDGHLYIAMDLLRGLPLDEVLKGATRLAPAAAAAIVYQAAHALAEAHSKQIVHRDLKPANLFVEPLPSGGCHIRVLDFGIARINTESIARSRTGTIAGTPAYMSPEQLRGEPDIDGRTDVYSLGVVLYRMLSGINPFRGAGGVMNTLRRHMELVPPPLPTDVPTPLAELTQQMLEKHREERPQSMQAVRWRLQSMGLVQPPTDHKELETIPDLTSVLERLDGSRGPVPPEPTLATSQVVGEISLGDPSSRGTLFVEPARAVISRRTIGWAAALILVGGALGIAILSFDRPVVREEAATRIAVGNSELQPKVEIPLTDHLAAGEALLAAEKWDAARQAFDRHLEMSPGDDAARTGRDSAIREAGNKTLLGGLKGAIDEKRWRDALVRLNEFPKDSTYSPRAMALLPEVRNHFAEAELRRGRLLIKAGDLKGARRKQAVLAKHHYSSRQAQTLEREIERAVAPSTAPSEAKSRGPTRRPNLKGSFDQLVRRALKAVTRGDRDTAIALLQQAGRLKPSSHVPHQRLCAVYKTKGMYKRALTSCKGWLAREPNHAYKPAIVRNIEQLEELVNR